jgi:hypothetical protein
MASAAAELLEAAGGGHHKIANILSESLEEFLRNGEI